MSVAKKTISTLAVVVVTVIAVAFVAARITHRKQNAAAMAHAQRVEATASPVNQPLFYTTVGGSDPNNLRKSNTQRVSRYTISVHEALSREDAERMLAEFEKSGIHGFYTPVRQGDHVIYYVRIGVFANEDEAQSMASSLKQKARIKGSVTRLQ